MAPVTPAPPPPPPEHIPPCIPTPPAPAVAEEPPPVPPVEANPGFVVCPNIDHPALPGLPGPPARPVPPARVGMRPAPVMPPPVKTAFAAVAPAPPPPPVKGRPAAAHTVAALFAVMLEAPPICPTSADQCPNADQGEMMAVAIVSAAPPDAAELEPLGPPLAAAAPETRMVLPVVPRVAGASLIEER